MVTNQTDGGVRDPVSSIVKNHPVLLWGKMSLLKCQHDRDGVVKPLRDGVSPPGGVEAVHGNHPIFKIGLDRMHNLKLLCKM